MAASTRGSIRMAANGDSQQMEIVLGDIMEQLGDVQDQVGQQDPAMDTTVPTQCGFVVNGVDGKFQITITPPQDVDPSTVNQLVSNAQAPANPLNRSIIYEVSSSPAVTFDTLSMVTTYPATTELYFEVQAPNQTLFWRIRSKWSNGEYGDYALYINPQSCGPISVYSGMLRPSAADYLLTPCTTKTGASPLSQDGVTTNILVAASQWEAGDQEIDYLSGHVDPGVFGTNHVYAIDLKKAGGQVTYLFTANASDLTSQLGIAYFGRIITAGGGGGTGSGGGGGYDPGDHCCMGRVPVTMFDGTERRHDLLRKGMEVLGMHGEKEILNKDPEPRVMPCFRVEFDNGMVVDGCSSQHSFAYDGGGFEQLFHMKLYDRVQTQQGPARISKITYLGFQVVWIMSLSHSRTFWAAGVGSHNANKVL